MAPIGGPNRSRAPSRQIPCTPRSRAGTLNGLTHERDCQRIDYFQFESTTQPPLPALLRSPLNSIKLHREPLADSCLILEKCNVAGGGKTGLQLPNESSHFSKFALLVTFSKPAKVAFYQFANGIAGRTQKQG